MSHFWRTILFIAFSLAFLVSAPLLVLYTAGYRLDLSSGRIVHTAALNISSFPRNATIYIDGNATSDRTPTVIDRILPGEHKIKLEKDSYLPWEKNITFHSREAVILQDVALFLDTQPRQIQTINPILTSVSPDGGHLAYITQQNSWIEVWITDGTLESIKLVMRLAHEPNSEYALSWSLAGTYLSLAQKKGTSTRLALARTRDGASVPLNDDLNFVDDYWWDAGQDDVLFARTRGKTQRVSITDSSSKPLAYAASRVRTFDARDVFWEESNNRVVLSFFDGTTASILTYLTLGEYEFQKAPPGLVALYDGERSRFVLIDANNREQPILLNESATHVVWNKTNDALLFTSGYDLKIYRPASHETQTLTRLSERVEGIGWYVSGNVALYQAGGRTIAINQNETSSATQTLLTSNAPGIFWQDADGKTLFLLTATQDGEEILQRELQK
jgi:hypothetical protein